MSNETVSTKDQPVEVQETQADETRVPCEVYSRIVGYLRPVQNWNKGKKQEFAGRRTYRVQDQAQ